MLRVSARSAGAGVHQGRCIASEGGARRLLLLAGVELHVLVRFAAVQRLLREVPRAEALPFSEFGAGLLSLLGRLRHLGHAGRLRPLLPRRRCLLLLLLLAALVVLALEQVLELARQLLECTLLATLLLPVLLLLIGIYHVSAVGELVVLCEECGKL